MSARARQSGSREKKPRATLANPAVTPTPQQEPVPEIRLLGSLQPVASREERIAIAAYLRAAQRQFASGHELDDWLEAEREIDASDSSSRASK